MKRKSPDMETIARRLNVSKTTVHYALRNRGRISDETRRKILSFAAKIGYRPNQIASSLRSRRTATIGAVVVTLRSSFHAHVLEGIDEVCQEERHGVLLACSNGDPSKERAHIEILLEKGVDGLIVAPADPVENTECYRGLVAEGIPLVFVDRYVPGLEVDSVATDNLLGGYKIIRHLLDVGRRRIAFLTTNSRDHRSTSVQARLSGCNQALREAGLPLAPVLGPGLPDRAAEEQFGYEVIREHVRSGPPRLDAVFAVHDGLAYGAIEALVEAGLRVPADVSVVGFDDQDPSAHVSPPLSTVRQPMTQIGREAARLLFRRIGETGQPPPRQRVSLEPTLVVRQSSVPVESPPSAEVPRRSRRAGGLDGTDGSEGII